MLTSLLLGQAQTGITRGMQSRDFATMMHRVSAPRLLRPGFILTEGVFTDYLINARIRSGCGTRRLERDVT